MIIIINQSLTSDHFLRKLSSSTSNSKVGSIEVENPTKRSLKTSVPYTSGAIVPDAVLSDMTGEINNQGWNYK